MLFRAILCSNFGFPCFVNNKSGEIIPFMDIHTVLQSNFVLHVTRFFWFFNDWVANFVFKSTGKSVRSLS